MRGCCSCIINIGSPAKVVCGFKSGRAFKIIPTLSINVENLKVAANQQKVMEATNDRLGKLCIADICRRQDYGSFPRESRDNMFLFFVGFLVFSDLILDFSNIFSSSDL